MKIKSRISSRILTMLLVVAMIMSFMPSVAATNSGSTPNTVETQSTLPFTDVKESAWYYDDVVYVYENSVMIGTGDKTFEPEITVTRGQFVKAIANMAEKLGYDTTGHLASDTFTDVKAGTYYDEPMGWAKQNGILEGTSTTAAEPDEAVTREQMATFLYRYVEFLGYVYAKSDGEVNYYDRSFVSSWASDAVTALTKAEIFNGIPENGTVFFRPQDESLRSQMAALLHRLLDGGIVAPKKILTVNAGEDYVVSATETYDQVVLGANATISADETKDYSGVTLTVDGVEMSILAGKTYTGNVVLTPVKNLGNVNSKWSAFRTAVYVDDNGVNSDYSAPAAVISGDVSATAATNVVMRSETDLSKWQESFNGILINKGTAGSTYQGLTLADYLNGGISFDYTITNPDIKYTGPGGNDFIGIGAAVMASGNSRVLLKGSLSDSDIEAAAASVKANSSVDLTKTYATNINNKGQVRTTLVAEKTSVVVLDGAYTKASDGEYIEGYVASVNTSIMKSVPWMLGLYGNVRANNLLGNATGIYYNSILESENWGVLSTDESTAVQLEVNNSIVRGTGVSTYGAYAIGNANMSFTDSYIFTPTYASIAANGANTTDYINSEIYSGRAGVMYHSGNGSTITFTNSKVQVVRELALMRGSSSTAFNLVVENNSDISFTGTGDHILVQLMENDDVLEFPSMNTTANYTDTAFAFGNKDNSQTTATAYYDSLEAAKDGKTSTAAFKDVTVAGDIYNSSVESGADLAVTLSGATLTGVVSSSVGIHDKETLVSVWDANGQTGSTDYKLLGKLTNYAFVSVGNDVTMSLTNGSTWTATGTSYLTSLTIDSTSSINVPDGYEITVNGTAKTLAELKAASPVTGAIEISPIKGALTISAVTYKTVLSTATGADLTDNAKIVQNYTLTAESGKITLIDNSKSSPSNVTRTVAISGSRSFTVPAGYYATLTIDGVEYGFMDKKDVAIAASSKVVITYTADMHTITNMGPGAGIGITESFRAGLYVKDGAVVEESSVLTAAPYNATASGIEGVTVNSQGDLFNGIMINGTGGSTYTIENAKLNLVGNGGDDFQGWGTGIMIYGDSGTVNDVLISKSYIEAEGALRAAIWAGGNAKTALTVDETVIIGKDADTTSQSFLDMKVPMMKKVPWALGLEGNNRVTGVLGNATATYTNSIVVAEGWGALSSDSAGRENIDTLGLKGVDNVLSGIGYLEKAVDGKQYTATKTVNGIKYGFTVGKLGESSGYVSYADQGITNDYSDSEFYAPDYIGIIAAGGSGMMMNNVKAESQRGAFMYHQTSGGTTTINGGSYSVADSMFIIKSQLSATSGSNTAYTDIVVDGADIDIYGDNAQSGTLLMLIPTDDTAGSPVAGSYTAPYEGVDTAKSAETITAVNATFKNVDVEGNIYNAMQFKEQALNVTFENSTITGAITSSYDYHVDENGVQYGVGTLLDDTMPGAYLYGGRVVNVASPTVDNPVNLTLTGTTWVITGTNYLTSLDISADSSIVAADGYRLTLTVDGVETKIESGETYGGEVVLTVTEAVTEALYGTGTPPAYRTALFVNNGEIDYSKSVVSALSGGTYTNTAADGVSITSRNNQFGGFIINDSKYTISNAKIDFIGDAGNDFAGFGAGLAVTGGSDVTVNDSEIYVKGQARSTIFVGSDDPENPAKLTVNNSEIIGADSDTAGNTCVWVFGATGNNRATNVIGYARIAYNNSIMKSQGWGILATDDVKFPTTQKQVDDKYYTVMIDVKDSVIEATDPDQNVYGSYSIGACYNSFSNTTFDVTGFAMVVANEYAGGAFLNGTEVNSERFGIQWHFNQGGETTIADSTFNTGLTTFLIKECSPIITVRNAELNADNGVIMQVMDSDDPGLGGTTSGTYDDTVAAKDDTHDVYKANSAKISLFGSFGGGGFDYTYVTDAQASFADMDLEGDFYNAANNKPMNMVLSFDKVDYTGVISSSTAVHPDNTFNKDKAFSEEGSRATFGVVENTASPTVNNGALVTLTGGSKWTVTGTCYLTSLTIKDSSDIVLNGKKIYVDYVEMTVAEIKAAANSTVTGNIIITDQLSVLNVAAAGTYAVTGIETYNVLVIGENATLSAANNCLLTMTVDGIETVIEPGTYVGDVVLTATEKLKGDLGSLTTVNTGYYWPYRTALYFEDNNGYILSKSVPSAVKGLENVGTGSASNISITGTSPQLSAMIFNGPVNYTVSDSVIDLTTTADGSPDQVNDFSALGAAIGVYNGATVTLDNMYIHTTGVAKPSVVTSSANMMMKNSTFLVEGGTLHDGYKNSAAMNTMVAPPWVLGIGGNARGTNLVGTQSVNVFLDCDMTANNWGVLSSDSGSNGVISVINSDVKLAGNTGYGIYVIGNVNETYYGANFDVATYAVIMTGGTSKFTSYTGGQSIDVAKYNGTVVFPNVVSEKVAEGTVVNSKVDSQFGVMSHNTGTVILEKGTEFNTKNAAFLIKAGTTTLTVDDSKINVDDGILIQLIDNDDDAVGADTSSGAPVFNLGFNEQEGWPTLLSTPNSRSGGINATFTNTTLKGDMYNASGFQYRQFESASYKDSVAAKNMNITLGSGATLEGVISKSRSMHVWMTWVEDANDTQGGYYDYMRDVHSNYVQATLFSINEYYNLGHVVNEAYADAKGTAAVTLKDGAVWTVTGTCYLTSLTIDGTSNLILPAGYQITVDGATKTVAEIQAAGAAVTGAIVISEI